MARRVTLGKAIDRLRYELSETVNVNTGKNSRSKLAYTISRVQQELADEFAESWGFLRITHYIDVAAGQRFYDFPAELPFENVDKMHYRYNGEWIELGFGIGAREYNIYDSEEDFRVDPVAKWAPYNENAANNEQIEVWPIPSFNGQIYSDQPHGTAYTEGSSVDGNGVLRFSGMQEVPDLIDDNDLLLLDDVLVVLYAAAEILAGRNKKDAELKLQKAQQRKQVLAKKQGKTKVFPMQTSRLRRKVSRPVVIRATTSN